MPLYLPSGGGGGAHPNLATHDALGLATDAELAALETLALEAPLSFDPSPPVGTQVIQALGVYAAKAVRNVGVAVASTTGETAAYGTVLGSALAWTRSGTDVTVTKVAHGLTTNDRVSVTVTDLAVPVPLGWYAVNSVTADTFVITGVNSGGTASTTGITVLATTAAAHRLVIPANTLAIGDLVRVRAFGSLVQNATSSLTFRIRVNGTSLTMFSAGVVGGAAPNLPNDAGTRPWVLDVEYLVNSTPGLVGSGRLTIGASTAAIDEYTITRRSAGASAYTLTAANYIDLTIQPNVSSASATVTCEGMMLWQAAAIA